MKTKILASLLLLTATFGSHSVFAQKSPLTSNWLKINNGQYGFVVGSNKKDSVYFVTVIDSKVAREDRQVEIFLSDGKVKGKATFVDEFPFGRKYVALYSYVGTIAKKAEHGYYDDFPGSSSKKFVMMSEGMAGASAELRTAPYVPSAHRASFQETVSSKDGIYILTKTGLQLERGMPVLAEGARVVVAIVAENVKATQERFTVISLWAIADKLRNADRGTCRYFNLLKVDETLTTCEQEVIRRKEEELRRIKEEIIRKNRTREERRLVRRNSDYLISVGPAVGFNGQEIKNTKTGESFTGSGYSIGLNLHVNPNPNTILPFSLRPRYNNSSFDLSTAQSVATSGLLNMQKLSIESYQLPLVFETGAKGLAVGLGYAPLFISKLEFDYYTAGDGKTIRKDLLTDHAQFAHRILAEFGGQTGLFKFIIQYQYQFGSFMNRQYEMVLGSDFVKPLKDFKNNYSTLNIEISCRLWGRWRSNSQKV